MIHTITSVEEPSDKSFRGGLYIVHVAQHDSPIYCEKPQADRMMFEEEMVKAGVSKEMVEKHRKLVEKEVHNDISSAGE